MIIAGVIAEFNPLHTGHEYFLSKVKDLTNCDALIVVMSGDHVQRGEPAIVDKYSRTKMALNSGADIIFELPVISATGSAQYFARGGVGLLSALGCVDYLVFASESGNIEVLSNMKYEKGVLAQSNDILGREYLDAIKYLNSSIIPITFKREGSAYNENDSVSGKYASASYIRNNPESITSYMSISNADIMKQVRHIGLDDYSDMLYARLINETDYDKYFDVYADLACKIHKNLNEYSTYSNFINVLKSKDIAHSHIRRALLHILLGITNSHMDILKDINYASYARLLGFNNKGKEALSIIKKSSAIPVISKLADSDNILDANRLKLLNLDIRASHIHSLKSNDKIINEYTRKIVNG